MERPIVPPFLTHVRDRTLTGLPQGYFTRPHVDHIGTSVPRGAGVLLILTSITLLHAGPLPMSIKTIVGLVSGVLLTLAFAWYGYTLLSGRTVQSMPSGHATAEAAR